MTLAGPCKLIKTERLITPSNALKEVPVLLKISISVRLRGQRCQRGARVQVRSVLRNELSNRNFSISGTSLEEKAVAVSLWLDELGGSGGEYFYERSSWADWNKRAKRSFFNDLTWARDNLAGIVRVVISVRDDDALGVVHIGLLRSTGLAHENHSHGPKDWFIQA